MRGKATHGRRNPRHVTGDRRSPGRHAEAMKYIALVSLALVVASGPALAAAPPETIADNPEMTKMFEADQGARTGGGPIDWDKLNAEDEARRVRVKAMLEQGLLKSGGDLKRAAFIFQHGDKPEHYLLAHTLAVAAVAAGDADARWIAAATLDRYLQQIGQPQIYGTQYKRIAQTGHWTQEPFDRTLLNDGIRAVSGVPSLKQSEERLKEVEEMHRPKSK